MVISSRFQRLAKEGGWVVAGQVATIVGSLALVRVLTEYLTPVQYGQLALGLTVAALVNQVVMGGIGSSISRFYSIAVEKKNAHQYLKDCFILMLYGTLAAIFIGLFILLGLQLAGYAKWIILAGTVLILSLLEAYSDALNRIQNAARHRAIAAIHGGAVPWVKIFFSLSAMFWLGRSSEVVVFGYVLSMLIVFVSQSFFIRKEILVKVCDSNEKISLIRNMTTYLWPFSIWGGFTWLQQVSDRWALNALVSTKDVGLYAVAFQLSYSPILLLGGVTTTFLAPILYQRSGDAENLDRNNYVHHLVWKVAGLGLLLTIAVFIITSLFHESIFSFFVGETYRKSSWMMPWMVLAAGVFVSGQMIGLKLQSELRSSMLIRPKVGCGILAIILNFVLVYFFHISGAIGALLLVALIYFVWIGVLGRNRL